MSPLKSRRAVLSAALGGVVLGQQAWAQSAYPSRPVKLIVPYAAGGGPDLSARKLAPELAKALGVNVVVENKVGAAGIVAGETSALLPPDGYAVLIGGATHLINKAVNPAVKYDPIKSFDPVTLVASSGTVLVVPVDSPYRTVQDLVAAIRAKPGVFNYGSGGIGTAAHLAGGAFCKVLGLDAVHVPYRGSVEIVPGLIGGQIQFACPIAGTAMAGLAQGKVRALAVSNPARIPQLPEVPALREVYAGVQGADLLVQESWSCFWVPAGTPREVIRKLFDAALAAHASPSVKEHAERSATDIVLSRSPEELAAFTRTEIDKWSRIVQLLGIKGV
jgi:tripartite-type tricarboxylate transporter receptor subunit TctC